MSASPFFYIEIYNRELCQWEKFDLYAKNYKNERVKHIAQLKESIHNKSIKL